MTRQLVVLAVEHDMLFDHNYAACMKLPFDHGWEKWAVYEMAGRGDLKLVKECATFKEADDLVSASLH